MGTCRIVQVGSFSLKFLQSGQSGLIREAASSSPAYAGGPSKRNYLFIFSSSSCVHARMTSTAIDFERIIFSSPLLLQLYAFDIVWCAESQNLQMKVVQQDTHYREAYRHNQCGIRQRPAIIARPDGMPQSPPQLHSIPHFQLTLLSLTVAWSVPVINFIHSRVFHPLKNLHSHLFALRNMPIVGQFSSDRLEKLHWYQHSYYIYT